MSKKSSGTQAGDTDKGKGTTKAHATHKTGVAAQGSHHQQAPAKSGAQAKAQPLLRELADGKLAGLDLHKDTIRAALEIPADGLSNTAMTLGRAGGRLPQEVLTPQERPLYARMRYQGQDEIVNKVALGLRLSGFVPQEGTTADHLDELTQRKEQYRGFQVLGDMVQTVGMNLRLTYGTFQWFMLDRVMDHLEQRFADPQITPQENEALLNDFGPLLINVDDMLRKGPENKDALFQARQDTDAQAQDALAEAAMAETIYQLHSGQTPERQALVAAAKRYFEQNPQALPASTGTGSQQEPARPKSGPRKMIR